MMMRSDASESVYHNFAAPAQLPPAFNTATTFLDDPSSSRHCGIRKALLVPIYLSGFLTFSIFVNPACHKIGWSAEFRKWSPSR